MSATGPIDVTIRRWPETFAETLINDRLQTADLCFRDAMLGELDDGEVAASDRALDVVEADADRVRFVEPSAGAAPATCSAGAFLHLHHLTAGIGASRLGVE